MRRFCGLGMCLKKHADREFKRRPLVRNDTKVVVPLPWRCIAVLHSDKIYIELAQFHRNCSGVLEVSLGTGGLAVLHL